MEKETNEGSVKEKELSEREQLFVQHYIANGYNATAAVTEAGWKGKYLNRVAWQVLQRPHVKAALAKEQASRLKQVTVSPDYVLRKLVRTVEKAEQESNHNATLRGLELLAKHLGMFIERQEISGPDGGAIVHEQKVKQNAADFASRMARLAATGTAGEVVELPNRRGEGGA